MDRASALSSYRRIIIAEFARSLRANTPVFAAISFYLVFGFAVTRLAGKQVDHHLTDTLFWRFTIVLLVIVFIVLSIARVAAIRPARPIPFLWKTYATEWKVLRRLFYGVPLLFILPVFFAYFSAVKSILPFFNSYYADAWLSWIDRAIHGTDPWRLLHPIVGYPRASWFLGNVYIAWFPINYAALAVACFKISDDRLRSQFLLGYVLCWFILGNLVAVALASVGPCYFEIFGGDGRYQPLMKYLQDTGSQVNLTSLLGQKVLLDLYRNSASNLGAGISAMPSMHVAMAMLVAIFCHRINRYIGAIAFLYVGLVLIASIHLGWHYAVDGYVAVLGVPLVWKLSGWIAAHFPITAFRDQKSGNSLPEVA